MYQLKTFEYKMKISELKTGQGNVDVEGVITEIGNTRVFNKFGKELKVADSILKDDSGNIKLTLWNDDIDRFKDGDSVRVVNGYVGEFQGEKQLTSGKFGRMEKLGGEGSEENETEIKKDKPKKATVSKEDSDEEIEEECF